MEPVPAHYRSDPLLACLQMALGHELPNRLVALQGLLRILELEAADNLNAEQRDYLNRTAHLSRRCHTLCNELAALVKASRAPLPAESVSLAEVVREVASSVKQLFPTATIDYHVASETSSLTLPVVALRQVLAGLIRALIQTSRSDRGSRVEIEAARNERVWQIRVNGVGSEVSEERWARLFDPLSADALAEGETGLELFSVRHCVECWGGTVTVKSRPGQGTSFIIAWNEP